MVFEPPLSHMGTPQAAHHRDVGKALRSAYNLPMKTRLAFRFLHTCLLGCLLAATAYADGEGGPLRFTVRVGAGIKGPVSGRLLVFFGPLQSASEGDDARLRR